MRKSGRDRILRDIERGLEAHATPFSGEALFVPSPTEFARILNVSKGLLYHYGDDFNAKLSKVTDGLQVVHNGIVLASDQHGSLEPNKTQSEVDDIVNRAQALTPEARSQIILRLTEPTDSLAQ